MAQDVTVAVAFPVDRPGNGREDQGRQDSSPQDQIDPVPDGGGQAQDRRVEADDARGPFQGGKEQRPPGPFRVRGGAGEPAGKGAAPPGLEPDLPQIAPDRRPVLSGGAEQGVPHPAGAEFVEDQGRQKSCQPQKGLCHSRPSGEGRGFP